MISDARVAHPTVSVRRLCELHAVSRSWYLRQRNRAVIDQDQRLAADIEAVVLKWNGYGYRRVTRELARSGQSINHKRVLRVMREHRLLCRPKRRYQRTTDSTHSEKRFPNLLPQVIPTQPDQVWQADLTYVRVKQGFVYLACVLDSFTREIVGWSMSKFIDADLSLAALNNALAARNPAPGLLHHSDQRAGPIRVPFCPRQVSNMPAGSISPACGRWVSRQVCPEEAIPTTTLAWKVSTKLSKQRRSIFKIMLIWTMHSAM